MFFRLCFIFWTFIKTEKRRYPLNVNPRNGIIVNHIIIIKLSVAWNYDGFLSRNIKFLFKDNLVFAIKFPNIKILRTLNPNPKLAFDPSYTNLENLFYFWFLLGVIEPFQWHLVYLFRIGDRTERVFYKNLNSIVFRQNKEYKL